MRFLSVLPFLVLGVSCIRAPEPAGKALNPCHSELNKLKSEDSGTDVRMFVSDNCSRAKGVGSLLYTTEAHGCVKFSSKYTSMVVKSAAKNGDAYYDLWKNPS
jgi:hypothetical protein